MTRLHLLMGKRRNIEIARDANKFVHVLCADCYNHHCVFAEKRDQRLPSYSITQHCDVILSQLMRCMFKVNCAIHSYTLV